MKAMEAKLSGMLGIFYGHFSLTQCDLYTMENPAVEAASVRKWISKEEVNSVS